MEQDDEGRNMHDLPGPERRRTPGGVVEGGGSAHAEAARRRARQQARLQAERETRPILGRVRQALNPETDAGAVWEKGGKGEERLAETLDPMGATGAIEVLHDRRIPGSRANIDHLVVAPSGIWVVDAKYYDGPIRHTYRGGLVSGRAVLTVKGRDRSSLLAGVHKQVAIVEAALAGDEAPTVRGCLCFIHGEWGLRLRPFHLETVAITWPKALKKLLEEPGPYDGDQRRLLADRLASAFPPASRH